MTEFVEIITVMDIVSTNKGIVTNVMNTASITFRSKRLLYFAHSFIRNHIIIDNYYLLLLCKTRYNIKLENNELKKVHSKYCTCYYFDDIIKLEDFNLDNIIIDEKSHKNILIYDFSYKTLIG